VRQGSWKLIVGRGGRGSWSGRSAEPRGATARRGPLGRSAGQLYDLAEDLGESNNLYAEKPELITELTDLLERLVMDGRSTPGMKQSNDVTVNWRRFLAASETR